MYNVHLLVISFFYELYFEGGK